MVFNSRIKDLMEFSPHLLFVMFKSQQNYYFECAEVKNNKVQELKPLSKEYAKRIKNGFNSIDLNDLNVEDKGYNYLNGEIPSNLIYISTKDKRDSKIVWHLKSHKNNLIINGKNSQIIHPNLIFVYNGVFRVYAYKRFNGLKTKLYKAPYPNIYGDAAMCWGNIQDKDFVNQNVLILMKNLEKVFFNTSFNALESANRTKSNTFTLYKKLQKKLQSFPVSELVEQKQILQDVVFK